jgi:hypothetical protein
MWCKYSGTPPTSIAITAFLAAIASKLTIPKGSYPHLHAIVADGCFSDNGIFHVTPGVKPHDLEDLFRYEVFKMLKAEGKITDAVIENMLSWPPARRAPTPRRAPQRLQCVLRTGHLAP